MTSLALSFSNQNFRGQEAPDGFIADRSYIDLFLDNQAKETDEQETIPSLKFG
jgi:hypothetical protein